MNTFLVWPCLGMIVLAPKLTEEKTLHLEFKLIEARMAKQNWVAQNPPDYCQPGGVISVSVAETQIELARDAVFEDRWIAVTEEILIRPMDELKVSGSLDFAGQKTAIATEAARWSTESSSKPASIAPLEKAILKMSFKPSIATRRVVQFQHALSVSTPIGNRLLYLDQCKCVVFVRDPGK